MKFKRRRNWQEKRSIFEERDADDVGQIIVGNSLTLSGSLYTSG